MHRLALSPPSPGGWLGASRRSLAVVDDVTDAILASTEDNSKSLFRAMRIIAATGVWTVNPNRKVAPSRWSIIDPQGKEALVMDQKLLSKLANPFCMVVLTLECGAGARRMELLDPRESILARALDVGPGEYALVEEGEPVAKLTRLKRPKQGRSEKRAKKGPQGEGALGRLRRALPAGSDWALVSDAAARVLAPPEALAVYVLFKQVTDSSGG